MRAMNGFLKFYGRLSFVAATLACAVSIADAGILKVTDYESGTFSGCGQLVDSPTRAGKKAYKIGLAASPTKETNTRCENPMSGGQVGGEYWYGTSFFFPSDWPDVKQPDARTPHYCLSQWINWKGGGCFPFLFQIWVEPGYKFSTFWYYNDKPSGKSGIATIKKGAWNDIVVHAKWSLSKTILEIYIHGNKVWTHSGPMGENCDGTTPKLQYRASMYSQHHFGPARYVVHDEYRMGDANSSYAEVAPGGNRPTPILISAKPVGSHTGILVRESVYRADGRSFRPDWVGWGIAGRSGLSILGLDSRSAAPLPEGK